MGDLASRSARLASVVPSSGKSIIASSNFVFRCVGRTCPQHSYFYDSFCGSTSDFCEVECQTGFGGCGPVQRPSCSKDGGSISKRSIGYYESWANTRACSAVSPEDLNLDGLTHINFAFVFFDPAKFQIVPMDKNAGTLLNRFTKLKEKKAGLQTWVSVGGWSFNDRRCFSHLNLILDLFHHQENPFWLTLFAYVCSRAISESLQHDGFDCRKPEVVH